MGVDVTFNGDTMTSYIPPNRLDLIQQCDVAEDLCVAYGYNNLEYKLPPSMTIGGETKLNQVSDLIRDECSHACFNECLNFALCSKADLSTNLNKELEENVVIVDNPKTVDTEVVRNSLIPGILRTLYNNKGTKLPIQLFELNDIALVDESTYTGAKN